jgi:hypothetical protein
MPFVYWTTLQQNGLRQNVHHNKKYLMFINVLLKFCSGDKIAYYCNNVIFTVLYAPICCTKQCKQTDKRVHCQASNMASPCVPKSAIKWPACHHLCSNYTKHAWIYNKTLNNKQVWTKPNFVRMYRVALQFVGLLFYVTILQEETWTSQLNTMIWLFNILLLYLI